MTAAAVGFLVAAGLCALLDWWAVASERRRVEYFAKPATLALLIGAAVTIDAVDPGQQKWFVAALCLSLVGDVALMLPRDRFVAGLTAFLLAHLAYTAGLAARGLEAGGLVIGAALALVAVATLGRRIVLAAPSQLRVPVGAYVLIISAMVAVAVGTLEPWLIGGALLFYASDALIGWTRFIVDFKHGRLAVMITYHLGQTGLVLGLL